MKSKSFLLILVTLFLSVGFLKAADNVHVKMTAEPSKLSIKAGEKFLVRLTMKFDKYWHTYSTRTIVSKEGLGPSASSINVEPASLVKLAGKIKSPKPKTEYDEAYSMNIEIYEGQAVFYLPLQAVKDLNFPKSIITIVAGLQLCDTMSCLPPDDYKVSIGKKTFEPDQSLLGLLESTNETEAATDQNVGNQTQTASVAPAANNQAKISKQDKPLQTESSSEIESKKKEGILSFLWFAMIAGAGALLTPCVFPMVPITVSFFTKRAENKKGRGLIDSLVYAFGIILTFTALGFILALIFGSTGIQDFATNAWTNMFIAGIFIVFAFNLFGAFEIQLPTSVLNKLNAKSQGNGFTSVLLMGLTFSLTSFTCTVPFVGSALFSASQGEWFYPIIGMLGFSAVFAAPFFLLALFPSAMTKLPKAGGWMNNIKVVMGFLEIAAAIKFVSNVDFAWGLGIMPRELFLAIWIGCGILITLYVLGVFRLSHDSPVESVGTIRVVFALIFASITFYLISGLQGKELGEINAYLPPNDYKEIISGTQMASVTPAGTTTESSEKSANSEISWFNNYDQAVSESKKLNKPLFVDFSGFQCTNCRWMELNMFPRKSIKDIMNRMVLVRLYTDKKEEPYLSYKKMQIDRYKSIALPLYVIITPDGEVLGTKAFTRDENEFRTFLLKAFPVTSAEMN